MLVRIENREGSDQTFSELLKKQSDLDLPCLKINLRWLNLFDCLI